MERIKTNLCHGYFLNEVKSNILFTYWYGAWNFETACVWAENYISLAKPLSHAPWANLVDLTHWDLGIPEIDNVVKETNVWCDQNNLTCEVVVCSLYTQGELAKGTHELLNNVNTKIVTEEKEAISWLNEKGFRVS
ncbi:MAG: hypothetical protein AAGB12_11025 [Pseudomonadota bacterium]